MHVNGRNHEIAAAPTAAARKAKLTHREIGSVARLLAENGAMQGDLYVYSDGWSDERVRDATGSHAAVEKIAEVRRDSFGKVASEVKAKTPKASATLLADLNAKLDALSARIEAIEKALT